MKTERDLLDPDVVKAIEDEMDECQAAILLGEDPEAQANCDKFLDDVSIYRKAGGIKMIDLLWAAAENDLTYRQAWMLYQTGIRPKQKAAK